MRELPENIFLVLRLFTVENDQVSDAESGCRTLYDQTERIDFGRRIEIERHAGELGRGDGRRDGAHQGGIIRLDAVDERLDQHVALGRRAGTPDVHDDFPDGIGVSGRQNKFRVVVELKIPFLLVGIRPAREPAALVIGDANEIGDCGTVDARPDRRKGQHRQ